MDTTFVPTTEVITRASMFLKKEDYQAAEQSLRDAIDNTNELIADNDLPRTDDALCDLSQAVELMRKALVIVATYKMAAV